MFFWSALLLVAFTVSDRTQSTQDITVAEAVWMSGLVHARSFTVNSDAVIYASRDLTIVSDGPIRIDGRIIGSDGDDMRRDAGAIRLLSSDAVTINGELRAGRGTAGVLPGETGGFGGDVYLEAPRILLGFDGVVAGEGGGGGPGARGGDGGDVVVIGALLRVDHGAASLYGGVPGRGGDGINGFGPNLRVGGDGGQGGSALQFTSRDEAKRWGVDMVPVGGLLRDGPTGADGSDGTAGGPCQPGDPATNGGNAYGSSGSAGGNGANGYVQGGNCVAGAPGGNGGPGGKAKGGKGGNGGAAGDCCDPPSAGKLGGAGGDGGNGTGGQGGKGGRGGDAPRDPKTNEVCGLSGTGGNGGTGGVGTGGKGGDGGDTGAGCPALLQGGSRGLAGNGTGGAGGLAGSGGSPGGSDGSPGGTGGGANGSAGAKGARGTDCCGGGKHFGG